MKKSSLLIIVHLIIFLALGGGVFWFYQGQISKKQSDYLSCPVASACPQLACAPCPKTKNQPNLPVVTFEAEGQFTTQDKEKLYSYLINPFFDYNNEKEIEYIAMIISKYKPTESYLDYDYEVMAIHKNGGTQGFLYSSKQYWLPDCIDGPCPLTEAFKAKYPQITTLVNP